MEDKSTSKVRNFDQDVSTLISRAKSIEETDALAAKILENRDSLYIEHFWNFHRKRNSIYKELGKTNEAAIEEWDMHACNVQSLTQPITHKENSSTLVKPRRPYENPTDYWNELPKEAFLYYWNRGNDESLHPVLTANYLTILWDSRVIWRNYSSESFSTNSFEVAKLAINAHLAAISWEIAKECDPKSKGLQVSHRWEIVVSLALSIRQLTMLASAIENIRKLTDNLLEEAYWWSLNLIKVELFLASEGNKRRNEEIVSDDRLREIQELLPKLDEKAKQRETVPARSLDILEQACVVEYLISKNKVDNKEKSRRMAEIIEGYAENPNVGFLSASYYKDAAMYYHQAGDRESARRVKNLSRQKAQESWENGDFKKVEVPVAVTDDQIQESIEIYFHEADCVDTVLKRISGRLFLPSVEFGRSETPQSGTISQIFPLIPFSGDRVGATTAPGEDRLRFDDNMHLNMELQLCTGMSIRPIFERLKQDFHLNAADLIPFIVSSEFIEEDDIPFIKRGIERYFSDDFFSSIHLLVPRIEQAMRNILKAVDADFTSYRDRELREKPFGELLREAERDGKIEPEIVVLMRALFTEEWGLNLRNKVAHGWLKPQDCGREVCERVLHTFFVLTQLRFVETS